MATRLSIHEHDSSSVRPSSHKPLGLLMERAIAAHSPEDGVIVQMPGDALRVASTIIPQAPHTAVCLASSEDWSDCGLA
jgi:hypothetical protein